MSGHNVFFMLGAGLILIGIFILIVAVLLISIKRVKRGETKTAGIILVGPIPIIFGNDKKAIKTILLFTIILTALVITATIIYYTTLMR